MAEKNIREGHELTDVNSWAVFITGCLIIVAAALINMVISKYFFGQKRRLVNIQNSGIKNEFISSSPQTLPRTFTGPRLQVNPSVDLKAYLDRENRRLSTFGWIDKKNKIVRIPIEDAMDRIVKKSPGQSGLQP